jgi:DNA ligase 1
MGKRSLRGAKAKANGVYDPNILKAVFLAGGPGSGKSFTSSSLFGVPRGHAYTLSASSGLKLINTDPAFEHYLRKAGVSPSDLGRLSPEDFAQVTEGPLSPRGKAKSVVGRFRDSWMKGRLGVIWDGTGDEYAKIKKRRAELESLGYDTFMVFVNTSLAVSQERNAARARKLPAALVEKIWNDVQENMGRFQSLFGMQSMVVVDNTKYGPVPRRVQKAVDAFLRSEIRNPVGRAWISNELALRVRENPTVKHELKMLYRKTYGGSWFTDPAVFARYKKGLPPASAKSAPAPRKAKAKAKTKTKPKARPALRREPRYVSYTEEPAPRPKVKRTRSGSPPSGVMLAKPWKGTDPRGWWMSEKLDGMRAYWTGDGLYTRNGNPIVAPDWFVSIFPEGIALDGELYMGRGRFQEAMSVTRKATARDPRWTQICYMAFDAPEVPGGCETRFAKLESIVDAACRNWHRAGRCPLIFVEQKKCSSRQELDRFHQQIEKMRGEGVMLRAPGSSYSRKRTSDLLKVKSFHDAEARITGHTAGTGKHSGRLGAYQAKLLDSGVSFKIGTGISDRERDRPLPRGTVVTVRFQELTKAGVPRFPSLVGARDYE